MRDGRVIGGWGIYVAVAVIQVTTLGLGIHRISIPVQMLLMPALAVVAVTLLRGRMRRLVLSALAFSWLGDTLPRFVPEDLVLLALIGSFAVAQIFWITALWPGRNRRTRHALLIGILPSIAVIVWCWPGAGALWPAVVIYAALLFTMFAVAASWGWRGALGGALFWFSDCLIAITSFVPGTAGVAASVVIMVTYAAAEGFLVAAASTGPAAPVRTSPVGAARG